jgi:hypothetical protein
MVKTVVVLLAIVLGLGVAMTLLGRHAERDRLPAEVIEILDKGDSFVLLSLDPFAGTSASQDIFHDHAVLGRVQIRDAVQRRELLQALYRGIANAENKIVKCWSPRHGIRAALGTETVDLVICFECLHLNWHAGKTGTVLTDRSPEPSFSRALESAGLARPIVPK